MMIAREKGRPPLELASGKDVVNYFCRSKHRQLEENVKESEEHKLVRGFCDSTGMPKLCEVRQTFQRYILHRSLSPFILLNIQCINWPQLNLLRYFRCCELNCVNVVFLLGQELNNDTLTPDSLMRAMLLLEPFLRSDIVKMEVWRSKISFFL